MKITPKIMISIRISGNKERMILAEKDLGNNEINISYGLYVNHTKVKENTQKIFDLIKEMCEL